MIIFFPCIFALISVLFMGFYKLSDKKMEEIIADLDAKRAREENK